MFLPSLYALKGSLGLFYTLRRLFAATDYPLLIETGLPFIASKVEAVPCITCPPGLRLLINLKNRSILAWHETRKLQRAGIEGEINMVAIIYMTTYLYEL